MIGIGIQVQIRDPLLDPEHNIKGTPSDTPTVDAGSLSQYTVIDLLMSLV